MIKKCEWFVYNAGQSPVHMLWFIQLINKADYLNITKEFIHWRDVL